MKYLATAIIIVIAVIQLSCTKEQPIQRSLNAQVLPGVWELRDVVGGNAVYNADNFKPGNGSKWAFRQSNYARLFKDSVYDSGVYTISIGTGKDLNTGRIIDQMILNNQPAESFELKNDTLRFYYGAMSYDGHIALYTKISDDTAYIKF